MASRSTRQVNRFSGYVSGNLAYDYDYLERERRRREERERREYAERRAREAAAQPLPRRAPAVKVRHRERQHVSPLALLGFAAAATMMVLVLMNYAQITAISSDVVKMKRELNLLREEHVELVSRYERTFDLAAVKEAAEATGMAKPSASQIYYIDLSSPDSVVLYRSSEPGMWSGLLVTVRQGLELLVEYFK